MALRIASTRRSRLDTPGTRPSRLWPVPTMAQASRSSRDGSIMMLLRPSRYFAISRKRAASAGGAL